MAEVIEFEIKKEEEFIELIKLLKATNVAESGAMAQILVTEGEVKRNGQTELRKRAKILRGEEIETFGKKIKVK
ncbi:MAG: RNA-binding S4 domain-containing protein [Bacteroidales bacterium]|nr:RNA-binding S4 domain-containing protein [Bacteroidales bacterium]